MKLGKIFLIGIFAQIAFFATAHAETWQNLEVGKKYKFQETVKFQDEEDPRVYFEAKQGSVATLIEYMPLDDINVGLWRFKTDCQFPAVQISMNLHESDKLGYPVGVALEPGCILEVFAELSEYYNPSLFN